MMMVLAMMLMMHRIYDDGTCDDVDDALVL